MSRPAMKAWVTVLPDPVAPTTRACRPLVVPTGMRTVRPRWSRPTARPWRSIQRPPRTPRRWTRSRPASSGVRRSRAAWARSAPCLRSSKCQRAPVVVASSAVIAANAAAVWSKGHSRGPSRTPGSAHVQCRPSHLRNITVDSVASAAAVTKIAALVSMWVSGSSGEPVIRGLLEGVIETEDSNGVVGVHDRNGTGNGTRNVRRGVVADLRDQAAARPRPADRLQPAGGLDRQLELDRHRQRPIGGKQHEIGPAQPGTPVRQRAPLCARDGLAGLAFGGAQPRLPPDLAALASLEDHGQARAQRPMADRR